MKKFLIGLFVLFAFCLLATPSQAEFNYPWQNISQGTASTTNETVYVTIEALNDNQSVFIDSIVARSDTANALITITSYDVDTSSWEATGSAVALLHLPAGTTEVTQLGSGNPLIPLFVGDAGKKIEISLAAGATATTGYNDLFISARRGTNYPATPSDSSRSSW